MKKLPGSCVRAGRWHLEDLLYDEMGTQRLIKVDYSRVECGDVEDRHWLMSDL
jgi:hypothetical protein